MKLLPEGFQALLAPAAMLPAALPRPVSAPMVSGKFVLMLGVLAGKFGTVTTANAGAVHTVASASATIMVFFMAGYPLLLVFADSQVGSAPRANH